VPLYALARAAVRTYCYGRRTCLVELLCAPIVEAVVRTRWSCCVRPLLTINRPTDLSEAPAWESAWYPGEAPGESGGSWLTVFLSLSLLSLEDALFLLCPWFSLRGFLHSYKF